MTFLKILKHLLPLSRVWKLVVDKLLKKFFIGATEFLNDIKEHIELIYLDIFPLTTREIEKFEQQFNIVSRGTEAERRENIIGRWRSLGGQGKDYLQDIIHGSGFTNVFIHEWWTDLGGGLYDTKNPNEYLVNYNPEIYQTQCGNPDSDCGNPLAGCGILISGIGTLLVNIGPVTILPVYQTFCGADDSDCGNPLAGCGIYFGLQPFPKYYPVPNTVSGFRFVVYVGGEIFPDFADVPADRKREFERILLSTFPMQQKIGLLINYV